MRRTAARAQLTGLALLLAAALPQAVAAQAEMTWREVSPERLVYMDLAEGQVIIELNPRFAPKTVAQFERLVKADFYRGLSFYRVIDGFVAQAGDESDINLPNTEPALPPEFELERDKDLPWRSVEREDLYQAETGFIDGFGAARDRRHVWLTHCPGAVAMARSTEPDSGSTDFYIVIGQAPRYLDRNLTIFGRVLQGMDVVQRIQRGRTEDNGVIASDTARSRISRMRMGSDLDAQERRQVFVMDTHSEGFADFMQARRHRRDDFFHRKPPAVLDVCQVPVATRVEKAPSPELPINP
jgi:peptidylprolyl isomerase